MSRHSRFVLLSGMLLFVLLVSLAYPVGVSAQDGAPPPAATEELIATEAPVMTGEAEAAAMEALVATEVPVEEVEGGSSIAEGEESAAAEEVTIGEVLEAAPESTEVVVLDENGEALPLVSTEAAEIVATADPMWCPVIAGVPTLPGGAGCSPNFGTPQALIDNMDVIDPQTPGFGLYEQPGIIYFTADLTDPGNSFILIGGGLDDDVGSPELYDADYDALKGYDLILQGGWSGVNGDTNFTQTDFGANSVQIGTGTNPWAGNITINDITINGVTTGTGLAVYTQGNIVLDNVAANDNSGDGAYLDNCLLTVTGCTGNGSIVVNSSTFGDGPDADTAGNGENGLVAYSDGNIEVTSSDFYENGADGLSVTSFSGSIRLEGVTANNNAAEGVFLNNCILDAVSGECTGSGSMELSHLTASGNANNGALLVGAGPVTVSQSTFNQNLDWGLAASSWDMITLSNVTANGNQEDGAMLSTEGSVEVRDSNFNGNAGMGLRGEVHGVTLSNVTANSNQGSIGIGFLSFDGDVRLDTVSASNNPNGYGLLIATGLALVMEDSSFTGNGLDGAFLSSGGDMTIICSQFNNNSSFGMTSIVQGTLTLDDVTFSDNGDGDMYNYMVGTPVIKNGGCVIVTPTPSPTPSPTPIPTDDVRVKNPGNIPDPSLSLHIVAVSGGENIALNCSAYSGTELILPNGDRVIFPCPLRDQAQLTGKTQAQLPGPLDDQFEFLSAMDAEVIRNGETLLTLNQNMAIDFVIPEGEEGASLSILRWDAAESQWVEVPGGYDAGNGRFIAASTLTGVFVLVTK